MSEENENSAEEDKENNNENINGNNNENQNDNETFITYEDDLITLLNKLSETIETFHTLSREQAENAILETNIKMNNCKEILEKMEEYINDLKDEEKTELNKKLLNYKTEYYEILNKFKEIQDNYINKKTENALMNEELIDEEDKDKNNIRITTGTNGTNNSALGAGNPYMVDGELEEENNKKNNLNKIKKENEKKNNDIKNNMNSARNNIVTTQDKKEISLICVSNNNNLGYNLSPNKEKEETFQEINSDYQDYDKKKKIIIIICVAVCILIFLMIFFIALFS